MDSRQVGVVLALFLVVALVPQSSPLASTRLFAAAAPSPDLWIGFLQTIDYLNPYRAINEPSFFLYGLLYDYPYSFDQDGSSVPNIVVNAACDSVCMNWTYQVRQGVYWSDGTQLTADDVAFTWNYDSQNLAYLWAYEPYFNQVVQCSSKTGPYCGAAVTSPWNVTLYFKRPYVAGRDLFGPIIQKSQWQSVSPACAGGTAGCPGGVPYANANPIGTGPFIADPNIYNEFLNALTPGGYIHVSRNPNYHPVGNNISGSNDIHIKNIYLKFFSDPNSLASNLLSGSVQLAQFSPLTIGPLQGKPNVLVQSGLQVIQKWNEIGISQIDTSAADASLNPTRWDINVRRAMAMSTNKDYIIQQYYNGQGMRGDTLISPVTPQWWYDPVAGGDNLTYNIQAANALLNRSGYTTWSGGSFGNGYRQASSNIIVSFQTACFQCQNPPNVTRTIATGTIIHFTLATRPTGDFPEEYATAQYLQQQYARIGVQLTLRPETTEGALSVDVYSGAVEMYIWFWSSNPDPNYMLSMQSSWTLDDWNDNFWNNATYNHYYLAQLADTSSIQRVADVQAAEKINYDMAPYIIYVYPYGEWAMRTDLWQNWGSWNQHPYRQMNAIWGANPLFFNLTCPSCAPIAQNLPPTPPVIQFPTYATWIANRTLSLTATSTDPETYDTLNFTWDWGDQTTTYCPHDQTVADCTASGDGTTGSHDWNRTGNYTVRVTVSDGTTPVTTNSPVYVNVTNVPPIIGWLAGIVADTSGNPIAGAVVSTTPGSATSSTTLSDGKYNITLAPGTYNAVASAHFYTTSAPKSVTVTANTTTAQDFALAPNPTVLQVSVTGRTGRPGQLMTISGTIGATGSGNWTLHFGDSTSVAGTYPTGNTAISQSHTYALGGTYTLRLFATTGVTTQVASATAIVDGSPPTTSASVAGTSGNAPWFRSSVQVTLAATDAMSGVASTSYRIDGGSWHTYAAPFSVSGDGSHTVEYNSTDLAGNAESTRTTAISVDTLGPSIAILAPAAGATLATATVAVNWSAVDAVSGVASVQVSVDNGTFTTVSGTSTVLQGLADGTHTVTVRGTDHAGNVATNSVTFIIQTAVVGGLGPLAIGSIAAVIVVVALVGLLVLRQRNRNKPKSPGEDGT